MSEGDSSASSQRTEFLRGARDIFPILVATVPFGLVFGALASHRGLSLGDSVLMSGLTFAGASQFAALEFWAHPLPVLAIVLSVMAVNLRLVLYSAALGRKVGHWPPSARYVGLGIISDPIFALAELNGGTKLSAAYYFGLAVPLYVNWIVTTAAGYVFGNLIEHPEMIGLDFVVIAYFIHVLRGFWTRPNSGAVIVASAVASALVYATIGSPWHFAGGAFAGIAAAVVMAKPNGAVA